MPTTSPLTRGTGQRQLTIQSGVKTGLFSRYLKKGGQNRSAYSTARPGLPERIRLPGEVGGLKSDTGVTDSGVPEIH